MLEIQVSVYMWKEGRERQMEGDNPWVYLLQIHISIFLCTLRKEASAWGVYPVSLGPEGQAIIVGVH